MTRPERPRHFDGWPAVEMPKRVARSPHGQGVFHALGGRRRDVAPQVIQAAKAQGLLLAETGKPGDTKRGQSLPGDTMSVPTARCRRCLLYLVFATDDAAGVTWNGN